MRLNEILLWFNHPFFCFYSFDTERAASIYFLFRIRNSLEAPLPASFIPYSANHIKMKSKLERRGLRKIVIFRSSNQLLSSFQISSSSLIVAILNFRGLMLFFYSSVRIYIYIYKTRIKIDY